MKNKFYPYFTALLITASVSAYGQEKPEQDADGYYLIGTADELAWFRDAVNTPDSVYVIAEEDINSDGVINNNDNYWEYSPGKMIDAKAKLTADIKLSELKVDAKGNPSGLPAAQWIPIGSYGPGDKDFPYRGIFDGQGHTVSGVYIDTEEDGAKGFFGGIENRAEIKNLGIVDSYISSAEYTGGICGRADGEDHEEANGSEIRNCYFSGAVIGKGEGQVGGICGETDDAAKCIDCYNLALVKNGCDVGGICGLNEGSLLNCYNAGAVSEGNETLGAICGYNAAIAYEHAVIVSNCYYLKGTAETGVGKNESDVVNVEVKTTDQFGNGEVAALLGDAYGQKLTTMRTAQTRRLPELLAFVPEEEIESYEVYTVSFNLNYKEAADPLFSVSYGNPGAEVFLPATDPERTGFEFAGWFDQPTGGVQYTGAMTIDGSDITAYARWTNITALEETSGNATDVHTIDGRICVTTPAAATLRIVSLTGAVVHTARLSAGYTEVAGLQRGIYIVVIDNKAHSKVIVH